LREATYSTTRFAIYEPLKQSIGGNDTRNTPFYVKFAAGAIAGLISSSFANPADIIKTRM
jgi:hypothetical protein